MLSYFLVMYREEDVAKLALLGIAEDEARFALEVGFRHLPESCGYLLTVAQHKGGRVDEAADFVSGIIIVCLLALFAVGTRGDVA